MSPDPRTTNPKLTPGTRILCALSGPDLTAGRRAVRELPNVAYTSEEFAAHLYQSRRQHRRTCERPEKGNKRFKETVLAGYQFGQSFGFNGDFRAWEHLLRIHDYLAVGGCITLNEL